MKDFMEFVDWAIKYHHILTTVFLLLGGWHFCAICDAIADRIRGGKR